MNFEVLPNELLLECFKYLNGIHILYSFDQLNYRLNKLIRNIPLSLNFQNISKKIFDEICMKSLTKEEIKKQIYSLKLSNQNIDYQIQPFLSWFSLEEFSQLQSLTLIEITKHNQLQLMSMLPSLTQLSSFHLINSQDENNEILSVLPTVELQTLTISNIFEDWKIKINCDISSIRNLTISISDVNQLHQILTHVPQLEYFNIENFRGSRYTKDDSTNYPAIHLKQLIMRDFKGRFDDLIMIFQRTPNLERLVLHVYNNIDMMNASQWEDFISSLLPYLKIFKFCFEYEFIYQRDNIFQEFKRFQSDFWQNQHQCYIEYLLCPLSIMVYTAPCILDRYQVRSLSDIHYNGSINSSNTFNNITKMIIKHFDLKEKKSPYYFSHVTSLTLGDGHPENHRIVFTVQYIESIKMIVNLSNVKHLLIQPDVRFENSSVLLQLLKQMSNLCSINIGWWLLEASFDDKEVCQYWNKMITKFYMSGYSSNLLDEKYGMDRLWKIFPNIEYIICLTEQKEFLLFLLKYLPKLSRIDAYSCSNTFVYPISWIEEEAQKLGLTVMTDTMITTYRTNLSIWIIRDLHK